LSNKYLIVITVFVAAMVIGWLTSSVSGRHEPLVESRMLMDTIITMRVFPPQSRNAVDEAFAVFAAVEAMASFHKPDSELAQLNQNRMLQPTASFTSLLQSAIHYYEMTHGYFDPSFAALQAAYGFYDGNPRLPDDETLMAILHESCSLASILEFAAEERIVLAEGARIDLGGIAGGFAIELAAQVLRKHGCPAFLIDDAGDIWCEGIKPGGKPWRIAVRDPRDNGVLAVFQASGPVAISTSGDYERFITIDEKRYGHIMNPITGHPVDYYSSVTVVASSPVSADALSTAVFAMPPEEALPWCEEHNLPALFLTATGAVVLSNAAKQVFQEVRY
jgi:thiamine biosynthesis lipoprotein